MGAEFQACKQTAEEVCCSNSADGRPLPSVTDEHFGTAQKAAVPGLFFSEANNGTSEPRALPQKQDGSVSLDIGWDETQIHPNDDPASRATIPERVKAPTGPSPPTPKPTEDPSQVAKEKERKEKERNLREAREAKEAKQAKEAKERRAREKKEKDARDKAEKEKQEKDKAKAKAEALRLQEEQPWCDDAGPFKPGARIEICLDNGWTPLGDNEFQQIKTHMSSGSKKFAIQSRGAMYIIDFEDMDNPTQTNALTKKARKLRLIQP